jgi:hypothetical protein
MALGYFSLNLGSSRTLRSHYINIQTARAGGISDFDDAERLDTNPVHSHCV